MKRAFTLIELLVTIAIIAILLALASTGWKSMSKGSIQTKCLQNLKNIGIAINLYASENDGALPGPTFGGQKSIPDDSHFLAVYLAPYLGCPSFQPSKTRVDSFRCPAASWDELSYSAVMQIKGGYIPNINPWGRAYSTDPNLPASPIRMAQLSSLGIPLSRQWAIRDAWGTPPREDPTFGSRGPSRHGKTSVLFFDGHVAAE
jgi:prepilin-type N-terminal cleavage/methylation domain-containing protein/prepilin-type processing-associated H-X9-DG protein